jgi:RNA polymerase sporulation-specific sigma factor
LALIDAIRSETHNAFEQLLLAYRPLVESATTSICERTHAYVDEVRAEAEYALYCAALSYDTEQEALTFGLYAKICIRNRLVTLFIRKKPDAPVSLDELYHRENLEEYSDVHIPPDTVADAEAVRLLYHKIKGVLSSYEMAVFRLWVEDYSAKEIAEKLGRDEKSVTNAIGRALAKLRSAIH